MSIRATKISAFLSGFTLGLAVTLLDIAKDNGIISFNADSNYVFPFFGLYFLVTGILFVIGIETIKAKQLHAEAGMVFWPSTKQARQIYYSAWLRMFIWFIGSGVGMVCFVPLSKI